MSPRYAPAFQDWSEIGPGVRRATRKPSLRFAARLCREFESPAQASATLKNSVAKNAGMLIPVDKRSFWMRKPSLTVGRTSGWPMLTTLLAPSTSVIVLRCCLANANRWGLRKDDLVQVSKVGTGITRRMVEVDPLAPKDQLQQPLEVLRGIEPDSKDPLLLPGERKMHVRL